MFGLCQGRKCFEIKESTGSLGGYFKHITNGTIKYHLYDIKLQLDKRISQTVEKK